MNHLSQTLNPLGQQHLLEYWDWLSEEEREHLARQVGTLPLSQYPSWLEALSEDSVQAAEYPPLEPLLDSGNKNAFVEGEQALRNGRAGCLVLAGGVGSRLGFAGPKGAYPLNDEGISLFLLHCEKIRDARKRYHASLPVAIMTSAENDTETKRFFEDNHFFGLDPDSVQFFQQRSLPYLDREGNMMLEKRDTIATGPNGNGEALHLLVESGIAKRWEEQGIDVVNVILVDNALAAPFDPELIGHHCLRDDEVTIKAIEREDPHEKVGVLVKRNGKTAVVEYSEMSEKERTAKGSDGMLKHRGANLSLFAFSMSFVKKVHRETLPLHKAWKKVHSSDGRHSHAWKLETFIFDLLPLADRVSVVVYPRETCFAPLKNAQGPDSPETLCQLLGL